jgi:hypothetical protein
MSEGRCATNERGSCCCAGGDGSAGAGTRVFRTTSDVTPSDRFDHLLARWGVNRAGHRVLPGLHALGSPGEDSPVFVTANYTLSFDALRSALAGADAYILVLDTKGVNVWCAAGKGTFGTDELVHRIESTGLDKVVSHRRLVLPQLGATGVAAHEVKKRSGFSVVFGPVCSTDVVEFMRKGEATQEMRRVRFGLRDRFVLVPVELVHVILPCVVAAMVLYFVVGPLAAWASIVSLLAGAVLFPVLQPWIPTPNFSTKGSVLGLVVALPFVLAAYSGHSAYPLWMKLGWPLVYLLGMPQVVAFLSLNFTGSTTFTSRTGVRREISTYFPPMVWMFGAALVLLIVLTVFRFVGGA